MRRSKPQTFEAELTYLLYDLCVEWGFCIPPADAERIAQSAKLSAEEFAAEVLRAEGFVPEYEKKWRQRIAQRFRDQFGEEMSIERYVPAAARG